MLQIVIVLGIAADGQTARVGNTRLAAQPACDLTGWWGNPRHSQDNMTITQVWYLFFFPLQSVNLILSLPSLSLITVADCAVRGDHHYACIAGRMGLGSL